MPSSITASSSRLKRYKISTRTTSVSNYSLNIKDTTPWAEFMSEEGFDSIPITTDIGGSTSMSPSITPLVHKIEISRENPSEKKISDTDVTLDLIKNKDKIIMGMGPTEREYHLPVPFSASLIKGNNITPPYSYIVPGILAQTGTLNSCLPGRNKRPLIDDVRDLQSPTILTYSSIFNSVKVAFIAASSSSCHSLAIDVTGKAYGWGRNDRGQIISSLGPSVTVPTCIVVSPETKGNNDINIGRFVGGAVGKSHSVLVDEYGNAYACGDNKMGQCGINRSSEQVANFRRCVLEDRSRQKMKDNKCFDDTGIKLNRESSEDVRIIQASCGEYFTVLLSNMGHIYTCGLSEFGQLGNGETGKYFITPSKLAFTNAIKFQRQSVFVESLVETHSSMTTFTNDLHNNKVVPLPDSKNISIASISCGKNHTIAIEAPCRNSSHLSRVFSWGCGDYGCLGHNIQADEYKPRFVSSLHGLLFHGNAPVRASAGAHCSMVLTERGHVYYWGKHKMEGEATMRPTVVEALANNGHIVKALGSGATTVFCATKDGVTVSWGRGTYGELGYGKKGAKSSSKPKFVERLDKCLVTDIKCGYGHTLFLIRNSDVEDKVAWSKLDKVDTRDLQQFIDHEPGSLDNFENSIKAVKDKKTNVNGIKKKNGRTKKI